MISIFLLFIFVPALLAKTSSDMKSLLEYIKMSKHILNVPQDDTIIDGLPVSAYFDPDELNFPIDNSRGSIGLNKMDEIPNYVKYITKKGAKVIKETARKLTKEYNIVNNITKEVTKVTEDYVSKLETYFKFLKESGTGLFFDEEFIFLNILDTACKLINHENWKLVNDVLKKIKSKNLRAGKSKHLNKSILDNIKNIIDKQNMNTKKEERRVICYEHDICIVYPAFSDYLLDIIKEMLKLSDDKLRKLVNFSNIGNNDNFLVWITDEYLKEIFFGQIKAVLNKISIRQFLKLVKDVLTERFQMIHHRNINQKTRIQAARNLLDIIDKSFKYKPDEPFSRDFNNTVKIIRDWANNKTKEEIIRNVLAKFIDSTFEKLNEYKFPIKFALIEIILKGHTTNEAMDNTLFLEGSKGVYEYFDVDPKVKLLYETINLNT